MNRKSDVLRVDPNGDRRSHAILERFFCGNRRRPWKLPQRWKSAQDADSHRCLEEPSAFPQFPPFGDGTIQHQPVLRQCDHSLIDPIFCLKNGETLNGAPSRIACV
jgi:hypothetical protein